MILFLNLNPLTKCTLCVEPNNNHGLHRCNSYPLPSDKLKRLKELKACTMCGKTSHLFDKCDFIFRSDCDHCHKKHFRFLCPFRSNARPAVAHNDGKRLDGSKNLYRRGPDKKVTGANYVEVKGFKEAESVETKCHIVCANFFQKNVIEIDSVLPTLTVCSDTDGSFIRGMFDLTRSKFPC